MLCVKRITGTSSVAKPSVLSSVKASSVSSYQPKDPKKYNLPNKIINPDITNVTIDFENRRITFTITYDRSSLDTPTLTSEQIRSLPEDLRPLTRLEGGANTSNTQINCPPIVNVPVLGIGSDYLKETDNRITQTLSISCETARAAYASFLYQGKDGIALLAAPKSITGTYVEQFFVDYFIKNVAPNVTDIPETFKCFRSLLICDNLSLTKVSVGPTQIKYSVLSGDNPNRLDYIAPRFDDEISFDYKAPIFNIASIPPDLSDGLAGLPDVRDRLKIPDEKFRPKYGPDDVDLDTNIGEDGEEDFQDCGFKPDIKREDALGLLLFNYSFFSEKLLDILFTKLWTLMELFFYFMWLIIPLCTSEWEPVKEYIRLLFSVDPQKSKPDPNNPNKKLQPSGDCYPPALKRFIENLVIDKVFIPATCCTKSRDGFVQQVKESLPKSFLDGVRNLGTNITISGGILSAVKTVYQLIKVSSGCIIYSLICFLRKIRTFLVYIIMWLAYQLLFGLTFGMDFICSQITGNASDKPLNPDLNKIDGPLKESLTDLKSAIESAEDAINKTKG